MALDHDELAGILWVALGAPEDKDGVSTVPDLLKDYALGYCTCVKAAILSNAPGTITGEAIIPTGPTPLLDGEGTGGLIVLVPSIMQGIDVPPFHPIAQPKVTIENQTTVLYIMATSLVSFASGNITGIATHTPLSPGPLTLGKGVGGKLSGPDGDTLAELVKAAIPPIDGPYIHPFYRALAQYTIAKVEAAYATGTIQGTIPAAGGNLASGVGAGGTIT